jgi:hypothetical protein
MERAVGFRRGSFPAALIVSADGRVAAGPPDPRSRDLCHFSRVPDLMRPVRGVRCSRRAGADAPRGVRHRRASRSALS